MTWSSIISDGYRHIMPTDERAQHICDENCICRPEVDDDMIVHNSFDGREAFESGARKPS